MTKKENQNFWKPAAIVIGILLLLSLYYNFRDKGENNSAYSNFPINDSISLDLAADKAISVINKNLVSEGVTAKLLEKSEKNGVYNIKISVNNRELDAFVSPDGKLLFTGVVELDAPPAPANQGSNRQESAETTAQVDREVNMELLTDDDSVTGSADAPVTIVEWSDFECPFCARFYEQTYKQIEKEYVDTGKVKLVFRDFPLGFHANAQKAAEAAECAGEQGKFWEMHNVLFEKGVDGGASTFKKYAKELSLNSAEFDECLDSGRMASEIKKDMRDGAAAGITGTPGFIINGRLVSGAQPFESFKEIIEDELAK